MSCYSWEFGTITLPAAEMRRLRETMRRAADRRIEELTTQTNRGWAYLRTMRPAQRNKLQLGWGSEHSVLTQLEPEALDLLRVRYGAAYAKPSAKKIREHVTVRNSGPHSGPHTTYRCGYDASITLAGNKVIWDVPENNHAPEHAHSHPLAHALFGFLETVAWTSRTGGEIVGNDEYNRDNRDYGGGGNYVVRQYRRETGRSRSARTGSRHLVAGSRF